MSLTSLELKTVTARMESDTGEKADAALGGMRLSGSLLSLTVDSDFSMARGSLIIEFKDRHQFKSEGNFSLSENSTRVVITGVSYNFPDPAKLQAAESTSIIMIIVATASAAISFNYAILLIKIYQMMDFMLLYNVFYPSNFYEFLQLFNQSNPFRFFPTSFQLFVASLSDDQCAEMDPVIQNQVDSCQLFANCNTSLLMASMTIGMVVVNHLVMQALRRTTEYKQMQLEKQDKSVTLSVMDKDEESKLQIAQDSQHPSKSGYESNPDSTKTSKKESFKRKIIRYLDQKDQVLWSAQLWYGMVLSFDIDVVLAAALNSRYYAGDRGATKTSIFNVLLSQFVIYGHLVLLLYYTYHVAQASKEGSKKYLLGERNTESWYGRFQEVIGLARNYLVCVIAVGLFNHPLVQVGSITLMLLGTSILEYKHKVTLSKLEKWLTVLLYLGYSICSGLLLLTYFVGNIEASVANFYIGWPLIIAFSGIVLINLTPLAISLYKSFTSRFCKKKTNQNKIEEAQNQSELNPDPSNLKQEPASLNDQSAIAPNAIPEEQQARKVVAGNIQKMVKKGKKPLGRSRLGPQPASPQIQTPSQHGSEAQSSKLAKFTTGSNKVSGRSPNVRPRKFVAQTNQGIHDEL